VGTKDVSKFVHNSKSALGAMVASNCWPTTKKVAHGHLRADAASGTIVWLAQVFAAATQQHDCRALAPILPYVNEPSRRLWRSSEL